MNKCRYCQETFRHYEHIEVDHDDGNYWKLQCPYCDEISGFIKIQNTNRWKQLKQWISKNTKK
jgi:hypothetical protein